MTLCIKFIRNCVFSRLGMWGMRVLSSYQSSSPGPVLSSELWVCEIDAGTHLVWSKLLAGAAITLSASLTISDVLAMIPWSTSDPGPVLPWHSALCRPQEAANNQCSDGPLPMEDWVKIFAILCCSFLLLFCCAPSVTILVPYIEHNPVKLFLDWLGPVTSSYHPHLCKLLTLGCSTDQAPLIHFRRLRMGWSIMKLRVRISDLASHMNLDSNLGQIQNRYLL